LPMATFNRCRLQRLCHRAGAKSDDSIRHEDSIRNAALPSVHFVLRTKLRRSVIWAAGIGAAEATDHGDTADDVLCAGFPHVPGGSVQAG
jgi:hypothetical protein